MSPKSLYDFEVLLKRLNFSLPGQRYIYEVLYVRQAGPKEPQGGPMCLRVVSPDGFCNVTGKPAPWKGRKWLLSKWMTDGEVVQTAFLATMTALEHEARENFKLDGVTVFDPHLDMEKLVETRKSGALPIKEREHV